MGAYLPKPVTETVREDGDSHLINYGASSMQGWRVSQEDAHSAILNYDTDTSFFAVFDGHGGPEVAKYCAQRLPQFIKLSKAYENGNFSEALEESFLEFDASLLKPEVIEELKVFAETNEFDKNDDNDDEDDEHEDEAALLRKEADIPIEDLMLRYNRGSVTEENEVECSSSSNIKFKVPLPSHLRQDVINKDKKPLSPYLRAKINRSVEGDEEMCSSSTCGSTSNIDDVSNSDNNCISQPDSTNKIDSESLNEAKAKPEECDKYNKSVQLSNGESTNISDNEICQSSHSSIDKIDSPDNVNEITTSNVESSKITSDSSNDNNDDINSSSHPITNADTSNNNSNNNVNTNSDSMNDGISSAVSSVSLKGKGKQRKITQPKRKCISSVIVEDEDSGPIYKSFLRDFDDSDDSDDSHDDYIGDVSDDDDDDDDDNDEEELDDEDEESSDDELDDDSGFIVQSSGAFEEPGRDSGCTAVVALLRENNLYVANAGDSRCVVSRNGKAIEMSDDHKPEDEAERSRVEKAGGKVTPDGRVNGGLNLSRAIGDHAYKDNHNLSARQQMITALPDIKTLNLDFSKDRFMVLACDGIWNSLTSQQVIDFIEERINKAQKLSNICDDLFNHCLASNTMGDGTGCDNMTCIIVKFNEFAAKRKTPDDYDETTNKVDTSITSDEPVVKRLKTDTFDNDREINSTEVQV